MDHKSFLSQLSETQLRNWLFSEKRVFVTWSMSPFCELPVRLLSFKWPGRKTGFDLHKWPTQKGWEEYLDKGGFLSGLRTDSWHFQKVKPLPFSAYHIRNREDCWFPRNVNVNQTGSYYIQEKQVCTKIITSSTITYTLGPPISCITQISMRVILSFCKWGISKSAKNLRNKKDIS